MKKVLITGVAGFIGSQIAHRFLSEGYQVIGVDDLSTGKLSNVPTGVDFIRGDLAESNFTAELPAGCELILHLAGQSSGEISFDDPIVDLEKNTVSTLNLIRYGIENHVDRIVYASSMSVYGAVKDMPINETQECQPLSCYGVGKLAAEGYLRVYQSKLPFVSLRMFNVYGPGQDLTNLRQGMVSIYLAQALTSGLIHVKGSLERFRDFVYVDDVVDAWFSAAHSSDVLGMTINVGSGTRVSVGELLAKICEKIHGTSFYSEGVTPGDQNGIYADTSRMRRYLAPSRVTTLDDGLVKFIDWSKSLM